jgi:putative SOS response-associated peptidase YedK
MFRNAIERQRCIVPADAFYEWAPATRADPARRKQPWCFRTTTGSGLLLMGGLWEKWQPRGAESVTPLYTCTILTTEANELVGRVHDRMPVLIAEADLTEWLSPEPLGTGELSRLIRPMASEALETFRVSTRLNNAREEGPDLAEPVDEQSGEAGKPGGAQIF